MFARTLVTLISLLVISFCSHAEEPSNLTPSTMQAIASCSNSFERTSLAAGYCVGMAMAMSFDLECFTTEPPVLVQDFINRTQNQSTHPGQIAGETYQKYFNGSDECLWHTELLAATLRKTLLGAPAVNNMYKEMMFGLFLEDVPSSVSLLIPTHTTHLEYYSTTKTFNPKRVLVQTAHYESALVQDVIFKKDDDVDRLETSFCEVHPDNMVGTRWCSSREHVDGMLVIHPQILGQSLKSNWQIMIQESLDAVNTFVVFVVESEGQAKVVRKFMADHSQQFQLSRQHQQLGLPLLDSSNALYSHGLLYEKKSEPNE